MITGLVIIGLFVAVLALGARLHEANHHLARTQQELERVSYRSFEYLVLASFIASRTDKERE